MREVSYKTFSRLAHSRLLGGGQFSDCQFELTFGCDYSCGHCYTACYNEGKFLKKELKTEAVKGLLKKMRKAGVLWLCFTGGDPLTRPDFLTIYRYAARLGFIITVFTNGSRITSDIIRCWRKVPPFVVEITLNAATELLYDRISGCRGSFKKVVKGLDLLQQASIPVKLKMQVTRQNKDELPVVEAFARKRQIPFFPSFLIHPRLNGDKTPLKLRAALPSRSLFTCQLGSSLKKSLLFPCAINSGSRLHVDPYGYGSLCCFWREPKYDLSRVSVSQTRKAGLDFVRQRHYRGKAICPSCKRRSDCFFCPGLAYLETGDPEAVVDYYCKLA